MKIFLIGFMGSGKSFIGKRLAEALCLNFIDLDALIERNEGVSISTLFDAYGETIFRSIESNTLQALAGLKNTVIATGGGTPCFNEHMDWMNEQGITIYLKTNPEVLMKRLKKEKTNRPLLADKEEAKMQEYIHNKLTERSLHYEKAQIVYEQNHENMDVVEDLVQYLGRFIAVK